MSLGKTFRLLLSVGALCASAHASTLFNFDKDNPGTSTTFTDQVNGLSATFSSPADPGGFEVFASMFDTLTGNVLGDPGPSGQSNLALDISFSSVLSSINLNFATADFISPSPLTVTAYENSQLIGTASAAGSFIGGFSFPEGQVGFNGGLFNKVVISSTAPDFAVDNIAVQTAPEPGAMLLAGFGLLAVGLVFQIRKETSK